MSKIDKTYHKLLYRILDDGFTYEDPNRKGVERIQISDYKLVHDFKDGFPALSTKELFFDSVVGELLWFLQGSTNIKYLLDNNINIWNKDAYNYYVNNKYVNENPYDFLHWLAELKSDNPTDNDGKIEGDLGRIYGAQWRKWFGHTWEQVENRKIRTYESIDQIKRLIEELKTNPMGTKHIVTAWNPAELREMALPPCHWSFEILVKPLSYEERKQYYKNMHDKETSNAIELFSFDHGFFDEVGLPRHSFVLKWHQRSVDTFLGLPFNIASYALLAHIIGKMVNMMPTGIIGDLSNVHIYEPHLAAVSEQLKRDTDKHNNCNLSIHPGASLALTSNKTIDRVLEGISIKDFTLVNYEFDPAIRAKMIPYNK